MHISPLLEEMKLHFLDDFARWITEGITREWNAIEHRAENGEFPDSENIESAMDYPLIREKYAAQAILHLLNTLVDEQLRYMAEAITEFQPPPTRPRWRSEKISNLSFRELKKIIEESYHIKLSALDGWNDYILIRNIDNASKHRSGLKHLREFFDEGGNLNEASHEVTVLDARTRISPCIELVRCLHKIALSYAKPS